MRKIPRYAGCFVCGKQNAAGAGVTFYQNEHGVVCDYVTEPKHVGYESIIHGGIITALLDECIGWAISMKVQALCVTGELTVRFKRSLTVGQKVHVEGFYVEEQMKRRRYLQGHGRIVGDDGVVYAEANGKFFPLPQTEQEKVLSYLEMPDAPGEAVTWADLWGKG